MENQPRFPLIAKTVSGLEAVLAEELTSIGAENVMVLNRAVSFMANQSLLYRSNFLCRTALRILKPLFHFEITDQADLYREINHFAWENFIRPDQTLAIDAVISYTVFTNSQFVAQRTKDAVVDRIRDVSGQRPSVDLENPDLKINVHIFKDQCTVALDSSGQSLHRRGYRQSTGPAPINEVLAAGLLRLSGWDRETPLLDPMCGSGTLLIEAAMLAADIPAGMHRKQWGFMKWNDFNPELWKSIREEAVSGIKKPDVPLHGSDRSPRAVAAALENLQFSGLEKSITVEVCTLSELEPPFENGFMIFNPPYDERIKIEDSLAFYKMIGDSLKQNFAGYTAWLISSDLASVKFIGLRPSRKIQIFNGPLECRFLRFDLFKGRSKNQYSD